jgi:glycine/D-amino acid oxidase-like deaminating enzyme
LALPGNPQRNSFPALAEAELPYKINGMFSFTPDSSSVIGESTKAKGFWVAEAVWVTHGGGVGKVVADLMTTGMSSFDLHEMDHVSVSGGLQKC